MANKGAILICNIFEYIKLSNNEKVQELIKQLPLGLLQRAKSNEVLGLFLNMAYKSKNKEVIPIIIDEYDIQRSQLDYLPTITSLCTNNYITREVLIYCIKSYPNRPDIDYFVDLINLGNDDEALKIAVILDTILCNLSYQDWSLLVQLTENVEDEEYENQKLRQFYITKQLSFKQNIKPKWIMEIKISNDNEEIDDVPKDLPNVKDAVDLILEFSSKVDFKDINNEDNELDLKNLLISHYGIATINEKINMLPHNSEIYNKLPHDYDDRNLFRRFGPLNSMYSVCNNLHKDNICDKYGGCRMLLCNEFTTSDTYGNDIDLMSDLDVFTNSDWFHGTCDYCSDNIKYKHYAMREPLIQGGWSGCFCSYECLEAFLLEDKEKNKYSLLMIERMIDQIEKIGIADR